MKADDVIAELRKRYVQYAENKIGLNPAALPEYLADFLGYSNLLYSHYAEFMVQYRAAEAQVVSSEVDDRAMINKKTKVREDKRTAAETENRITIRMSELKGNRERLEAEVKSATIHINTIQSLMRRYSDEAKGTL